MSNRNRKIQDIVTETPYSNEIRQLRAPINGNIDTVLETIITLRNHGVLIYNVKQEGVGPDCYGERPDDPNWKFFITPQGSRILNMDIKGLGMKQIIMLPDKYMFIYDTKTQTEWKSVYLFGQKLTVVENEDIKDGK